MGLILGCFVSLVLTLAIFSTISGCSNIFELGFIIIGVFSAFMFIVLILTITVKAINKLLTMGRYGLDIPDSYFMRKRVFKQYKRLLRLIKIRIFCIINSVLTVVAAIVSYVIRDMLAETSPYPSHQIKGIVLLIGLGLLGVAALLFAIEKNIAKQLSSR